MVGWHGSGRWEGGEVNLQTVKKKKNTEKQNKTKTPVPLQQFDMKGSQAGTIQANLVSTKQEIITSNTKSFP